MDHADIAAAAAITLVLAWIADLASGRRGIVKHLLVSGVGAACGAFLGVRVFAVATMDAWPWVGSAAAGAAIALLVFLMTRSKR